SRNVLAYSGVSFQADRKVIATLESCGDLERQAMSRIIILKLGTALDSLLARRGDFEHYFAAGLGVPIESCRIVDPRYGDAFPEHDECRAVVITGSPEMITDDPDWSRNSERWIREGIDRGTPFLGICYGHQLLAKVLGAP